MKNELHKIGEAIATLRKNKGWTQEQLANMIQVSTKRYLNGSLMLGILALNLYQNWLKFWMLV